jgi:hypothetical protein
MFDEATHPSTSLVGILAKLTHLKHSRRTLVVVELKGVTLRPVKEEPELIKGLPHLFAPVMGEAEVRGGQLVLFAFWITFPEVLKSEAGEIMKTKYGCDPPLPFDPCSGPSLRL